MKASNNTEIIGIQYLRGIAAVAVVVDHSSSMVETEKYFGKSFADGFLTSGAIGVDLFFLISGFIICMISLAGENLAPKTEITLFFKNRFCRIIPIMWVAIISYALLRFLGRGGAFTAPDYIRAMLLIPSGEVEPRQIWTLRHEAIFYILFAASFLGKKRRPLILAAWFLSPLAYAALGLQEKAQSFWPNIAWIIFNPSNLEFAAGFLIAAFWHRSSKRTTWKPPINACILFTVIMIGMMTFNHHVAREYSYLDVETREILWPLLEQVG